MYKLFVLLFVWVGMSAGVAAQDSTSTKKVNPKTAIKDFSYAYGYSFAKDLKEKTSFSENELVVKEILKGLKAALKVDSAGLAATNKHLEERLSKGDSIEVSDEEGKVTAYHLGYNAVGNMISMLELPTTDFNYGFLKKGYWDYAKGKTPKFKVEDMEKHITTYFQDKQRLLQEKRLAERKAAAEKNLKIGNEYLAENAKKEGIKTTASGIQYQVIKEGTGEKPTINNTVTTHYTGTLIDGKVFDSSIERGQPATFPLQSVIKGWQEGIPLMAVGSRYRLFIPAELGYGENSPPSIPPNSVLIFDVELLEIVKTDGDDAAKGRLSYAYGFMVGRSIKNLPLTEPEKDPTQFVQGFAKGFESTPKDVQTIETLLRARIEGGEAPTDADAAKKIAFGIGYSSSSSLASQLGIQAMDFDYNALGNGYQASTQDIESRLSDEEMNEALKTYFEPKQEALRKKMEAEQGRLTAENKAAGAKFMAENAKKEGVKTLPNGMQYEVLKEGTGPKPTATSKVKTHYHGTLIDGTVFDSSVDRGEPATFPLNGVIKGWQEGIPLMSVGSKYRFYIPSELAYGDRGAGASIPPGATLIFEVELIEIPE